MIRSSVEKPDPKNANFIKATEDLLGTKIGSPETHAALEKLDTTQKAKIAAEVDKQVALEESKAQKASSLKSAEGSASGARSALDLQKFAADQKARRRKAIRTAIYAVTGFTVGPEIGKQAWKLISD